MSSITLTKGQEIGSKLINKWFTDQNEQLFKLGGYAGTGKTYMTQLVIEDLPIKPKEVAFCAFTGKASLVLIRYLEGKYKVTTIHRLIYNMDYSIGNYKIKDELKGIKLIVVDEASMVSLTLFNDLKGFGIPILAIGDHGQLEAIGEQANLMKNPDHCLDEIMRQNEGNPLIHLSTLAREGKKIDFQKYGDSCFVMPKSSVRVKDLVRADQVICGYNNTLQSLTPKMRAELGMKTSIPEIGDKIIFNRNNYKILNEGLNIYNGMIGYIVSEPIRVFHLGVECWNMDIHVDFMKKPFENLLVPVNEFLFRKSVLDTRIINDFVSVQYGNIITCHKAIGDQFDKVFVIDESFGDEPWRWLYTAITRAKMSLILALNDKKIY